MKKVLIVPIPVLLILGFFALPVIGDDTLVRFEGGIGVSPLRGTPAVPVANTVQGVSPPGQFWRISDLDAKIKTNGDIQVDGEGLLLAGGDTIGTNANQTVGATLFCGGVASSTPHGVPLEPDGDFKIKDTLSPLPPPVCANPVLLIRSFNTTTGVLGVWFAAGIPKSNKSD
ncbi:MAG TPA: hypothetical protein VGR30_01005 [Candidatus Binatia bacterium]|jgi:hypothetical protein|nr:hypothetical protein [Candidatus Binatia bacterium]